MRLVSGGTLRECVADFRAQPGRAAKLIVTVARRVHHAHQRGILHRDLKPGNILLDKAEQPTFVSDFGLAKWLGRDNRLTLATSALGTPHYIAPEQAAGVSKQLTPAADVYSLGAILYELLAGRPPFVADTPLETLRLAADTPPPAPRTFEATIPRDLELICLKCLAKEPSAGDRSAAGLAEDFDRWLEGRTILARPSTPVERAWRWTKRNPIVAALSSAIFIGLLSFLIALFTYWGAEPAWRVNPGPAEKSIAVLPFLDLSQAKDQEYFCDGVSEEILSALAKIEGLRVVARTSSFSFKGSEANLGDIGRKLNVENVVEGSVRRNGNRIRISAQLISARDGLHLWSETYERELQDVFAVQDEITRAVVDALKSKLAVALPARARQNTEAYDLYLQGLYLSNKSDEESLRQVLSLFQSALDKDPNFARAWTGIAKVWLWLSDAYVEPLEAGLKSEEAAEKALALDERDAEARCYLGEAKRVLHCDLAGEDVELRRALETDPNCAVAYFFLALLRSGERRIDEALSAMEQARRLDPLSPIVSRFASVIYLGADQLENAIAEGQRTAQLDPNYVYFESGAAAAYREKGEFEKAIAIYKHDEQISGIPRPGLAVTYAKVGREGDARAILAQLIDLSRTRYFASDSIAEISVALDEQDEAFQCLDPAEADYAAPPDCDA